MKSLCMRYGKRWLSMLLVIAMVFSLGFLNTTAKAISVDEVKSSVEAALLLSELFSGDGTNESPYLIADEQDLIELQLVSNGTGDNLLQTTYAHGEGLYFKLTADISLTADWTPIASGSDYYFAGSFDGGGHTISGLSVTAATTAGGTAYGGLFGYTDGAAISNLTVTGSVSVSLTADDENTDSSAIYAGGIVGFALDTAVTDCSVTVTVNAVNAAAGTVNVVAGGAVGYLGTSASGTTAAATGVSAQSGTYVYATTSAHGSGILTLAGGVVGIAEGATVDGCSSAAGVVVTGSRTKYSLASYTYEGQFGGDTRTGTYDLNGYYYSNTAGGVVGAAIGLLNVEQTDTASGNVTDSRITAEIVNETVVSGCSSTGTVINQTDTSLSFAGGVVGTLLYATVTGDGAVSNFSGSVSAPYAGGIAGIVVGTSTVSGAVESGTVSGTMYVAGGVAGQLGNHDESSNSIVSTAVISNCAVTGGSVTCSDGNAGGIVGYMTYADSISGCTNAAAVSGSDAGGILGEALNSYSSSGGVYAGGGIVTNVSVSYNAVTDCKNTGTVSGSVSAGGIAGYVENPCTTISDCSNSGTVTSTASDTDDSYAGGVIAYYYSIPDYSESLVRNVGNNANVTGSATYAGGVIGYLDGNLTNISSTSVVLLNSYNGGTVIGGSYAGGVVGYAMYGMSNCYNSGTVSGTSYVGALLGEVKGISVYSDSYALSGSASSLVGSTTGNSSKGYQENLLFFDTDQKLTDDTNGYGTLIVALNAYAEENSTEDAALSYWQPVSGGYPTFTEAFTSYAATTPDTPAVTYTLGETSGTDTSVTYAAGSGDTLVLTTDNVTCEDGETILYQWYSSTSDSVSTAAEISGATGVTYTVDTSKSGTTYYWVSAAIQNSYTRTVEVFSAAFTVAVEFTINDDGSINGGTFVISLKDSGDATNSEENPYIIDTAEKLMALPAFLNTKSDAYYFEQTADIDLESAAWSPIGPSTTYPFKGVYDGGGYTVKGLYINAAPTANYGYGMFGYVSGGTVKNLTVSGEITITTLNGYVGGIVGYAAAGSTIDSCATEDMTVSGGLYTGGIVGEAVKDSSSAPTKITDCTNGADVINSTASGYAGGILGYSGITSNGAISNLTNNGSVTTDNKGTAGGIIGFQYNGGTAEIENVVNNGAITSSGSNAGGLIGYDYGSGSIDGVNTGTIYCENNAGGLVGYNRSSAKILNSANTGAVSGGNYVGGLVGYSYVASSVLNSSNTGEINGGSYVGGLAGYIRGNVEFINSYNAGTVTGEFVSSTDGTASYATYVGGLVGYMSGSAYNCYNSAAVTGGSDAQVGALLGYLAESRTISSSYYPAQDDIEAVAEAASSSTVEYLGSFDTAGTLTAADEESGLAYTGDLLNQLNAWVIDNLSEYNAYGWIAQDDGYPILSFDVDLSGSAPAAVTVEMSEENPSKVALNSSGAELTANITLAEGIVGIVTYKWLADGEVVSSGTFETTSETTELTSSVTVPTDTYGPYTYTLEVVNTNPDYAVYQSGSAETTIVVNKPEEETKWYGSWDVADSFAGGTGTEDDPYLISEANQLALLAQYVNAADSDYAGAYYKLIADIDLNSEQWTRIGSTNSFTGYFDGDSHSITGLYFSGSNSSVGLFGYISGATIENLSVTGSVEGMYAIAVLAGKADGTNVIRNVLTYGSVTSTTGASDSVMGTAGLVGYINIGSLTMTNCGNEADVTAAGGSTSNTRYAGAGGLVGLFYGSNRTLTIDSCYNAGTISANGSGSYAVGGGLIGWINYGLLTLTNSYNIGTVAGSGTSAGLIGALYNSRITKGSTIENCYNAGTLAGTSGNYSLLGYGMNSTSSNYTVTNCYYLSTVCADVTDSGRCGTEVNTLSASLLNGESGSAFADASPVGTVNFETNHTSVTLADSSETIKSASASAYPYLSWQSSSPDSYGYVAFQVSLTDSDYTLADVTAAKGNVVTIDADNYVFVAAVTGNDTVTVSDMPAVNLTVTGENAALTFVSGYVSATETEGRYTVAQNTTVTFTVKAASGYAVTSVSAVASGEEQILTADDDGVYTLQIGTEGAALSFVTQPMYKFYYTLTNAAKPEILSGSATFGGTTTKPTLTLINGDTVAFSVAPNSGYVLTPASVAFTVTKTDAETGEQYEYTAQTLTADDDGVYSLMVSEILADGETALVDSTMKITAAAASVAVDSEADLTFTGSQIMPDAKVTVDGSVVSEDCYTLSYSDNIDAGTATVTATMKSGYVGTLTGTFSIEAKELTENDFTVPETAEYNYGSAVEVEIVSDFEADVDYTVSYDNNINAGTATLTITGIGNYTGTLTYEFEISAAELSGDAVAIDVTGDVSYTGEDVKPAVTVTLGESELTEGTDYTVEYGDETTGFVNAGSTVTVTVTFTGNYSGTATATYTIAKADQTLTVNQNTQELPANASKDLSALNLVGGNQTELFYSLAEGEGFTLNGSVLTTPETAGATAIITIYAVEGDNYNASESVAVTVTTVNKAEVSVTFEDGTATYTGEALTHEAASVNVEETNGTWTYVYYDADGTMLDSAPTDAGTYTVIVTYTSDDSTGTASAYFTIYPQSVSAAAALADSSTVYTYTGNAIEPDVTITVGETVLTEDTVYTYEISYADNVNVGTATATVTFTGNYAGSASAEFTIAQRTLSAEDFALESDSVVYNGSAQTPITLADGLNLTEDTDYSIKYANNTDVGTATVTITGIEPNCTGSVELTFEITGSDVSENITVTVADETCVYTGEAIEPAVTVTMGEETLTEDDYTVEYANNVNAGTATVTVTLTGNYSGTVVTENFTIEKAEQTLVMKDSGTIIAEIDETLDLTTLIDESSSYAGTLVFGHPNGFAVTGVTTLSVTQAVEADTEIELTVYALGTDNYSASETVTFTVTAVARTSITIDSGNAEVAVYERTTETDEDGEVQTVDTPLSADETGAYSAKQGMTISFTVTPASGYGMPTVTVNGETVKPDEDGYYVVELTAELLADDSNLVISVSAKRTSWDETGNDTADADIESIIASDAADTQSKDADGSTYKDYLDYNDDGKNDLLDILQILYRTENTDNADETVEEVTSEETTEEAAEVSDESSEEAAAESDSDADSDESSEETAE